MRVITPGNVPIEDLPAVPEPSDQPADKEPGEPTPEQGTCAFSRAIEGSEECKACPEEACPNNPACEHAPAGMAGVCDSCASMQSIREALDSLEGSLSNLFDLLAVMQASGFVAKTTEATRTRAKIENGASVQLVLHKWNELLPVYGAERLNSRLTCSQVTDTHAVITTEDGTCLGAIRMTHLRVRPVKQEME